MRRRGGGRRWVGVALPVLVALLAFGIGAAVPIELRHAFFYQTLMPATVVAACGLGWAEPVPPPPALVDFIFLRAPGFDCAALQGVSLRPGAGVMTTAHFYLASVVAWLWGAFGFSATSLWPLAGGLHALYATGGHALGRLLLGRWAGLLVGLALALSPIATSVLAFSLRDYAKAGFFAWAMVCFVLALRMQGWRGLLAVAVGFGAVVGIGAGFRADVNVMLPIGLVVLTLGQWGGRVPAAGRLGAAAAFLCTALALILPLQAGVGGSLGAQWLQGTSEPFRYRLQLPPAPYDLGERYSDELAYSGIAADLRRRDPAAYDAGEGVPNVHTQSQRAATTYVSGWAHLFAADVTTRALAAAWLTAGMPALVNTRLSFVQLYDVAFPSRFSLSQRMAVPYRAIASKWAPVVGTLGLLALLLQAFARSRREALWLGLLLVAMLGLPSLQFALRHVFHMEVAFWLGVLALPALWPARRAVLPRLPAFAAWVGGFILVGAATQAGLGALQQRLLGAEVAALLAAPRSPVALAESGTPDGTPDGRVLLGVAVPEGYRDLLESAPDSASIRSGPASFDTIRAGADRLLLEIGGPTCEPAAVALTLAYRTTPVTWQAMTRDIAIPRPPGGWAEPVLVVVPAFYRASQHFSGIALPPEARPCLRGVSRIEDDRRLPILFSAVLAPGWETRPLSLGFRGRLGPAPPR